MKRIVCILSASIFLSAVICSCQRTPGNLFMSGAELRYADFSEVKSIDISPSREFITEDLRGLYAINSKVDNCLILSFSGRDYEYSLFDINEGKTVVDFLKHGRGPNETVSVTGVTQIVNYHGVKAIVVDSTPDFKVKLIDFESLKSTGKEVVLKEFRDDRHQGDCLFTMITDDGILVKTAYDKDIFSFKLLDSLNFHTQRTYKVFGEGSYLMNFNYLGAYSALNVGADIMALAMNHLDKINFLDLSGDHHFSTTVDKRCRKDNMSQIRSGSICKHVYYKCLTSTEEYLYALYVNEPYDVVYDRSYEPLLQVFDWDGNPVAQYHIHEPLISIAVSEDGGVLYGTSDDEVIYEYKL